MLEYIFDSRSKVLILRLLVARQEWIFSLSEVSRELGIPKSTISRNMKPLAGYGIIREFKKGTTTVFQLNLGNYIVGQLIIPLFAKEMAYPVKKAHEFCSALKEHALIAIIFGSAAEGTMTPTSDIDIALISHNKSAKIVEKVAEELKSKYLEEEGLIFSVHTFGPSDFKKRYAKKDPLIVNIVNGKAIFGDIEKMI